MEGQPGAHKTIKAMSHRIASARPTARNTPSRYFLKSPASPVGVKRRNTLAEHMFSASRPTTDMRRLHRNDRFVPIRDIDRASRHPPYQLTAYQGFPTSKANKTLPGRPPH
jgi:hypothetical protein